MSTRRARIAIKNLCFSILPALVLFVGAEVALRLIAPFWMECVRTRACPAHDHRPLNLTEQGHNFSLETHEPLFVYHPRFFWWPRSYVQGTFWSTPDVKTNRFGLRDDEVDMSPGRRNILFVGDSVVWGSLVYQEDRFTEKTHAILQSQPEFRDVQLINAGVLGFSTFQVRTYLKEEGLDRFKPEVVVICAGINDNWPFSMCDREIYARNMRLGNRLRRWCMRSDLFLLLDRYVNELALWARTGENPQGFTFLFRESSGKKTVLRNQPHQTEQNLREAGALIEASGARVVIVLEDIRARQPGGFATRSFKAARSRIRQLAAHAGWPVIEIAKLGQPPIEMKVNDYLIDFCHLHPRGHEVVGRWLADVLTGMLQED